MTAEQNDVPVRHRGVGPVSLALPPIDRLPSSPVRRNALAEFVRSGTSPWGGVPVSLSSAVVGSLWTLLVLNLVLGAWLLAVRAGSAPCSGVLCWAATLGGHPMATLLLSVVCSGALVVSAPVTRGLCRAAGPQLALIVLGALTGVVAVAGLAAVLAAGALALVVVAGIVVVLARS